MIATKRRFFLLIILIFIIVAGYLGWQYYQRGKLIVTVSDPLAKISLINERATRDPSSVIGTGKASVRLTEGEYTLEAQKNASITRIPITIKARSSTTTHLNLKPVKSSEVLTNDIARDIKVTDEKVLTFLNAPYQQIFQRAIGALGFRDYRPELYPVKSVEWLDNGGAIIASGSSIISYLSPSGSVHSLSEESTLTSGNFVVAPMGTIVFLDDSLLKIKTDPLAPSAELMKLEHGNYNLSKSDNGKYVLAYEDVQGVDTTSQTAFQNYLIDTSKPRNPSKFESQSSITSTVLGDDGQTVVYVEGSKLIMRDIPSGISKVLFRNLEAEKQILELLIIVNKDRVLYSYGSSIWEVDLANSQSYRISGYDGSLSPDAVTYDKASNLLYFSTDPDTRGKGGHIYRIKL